MNTHVYILATMNTFQSDTLKLTYKIIMEGKFKTELKMVTKKQMCALFLDE